MTELHTTKSLKTIREALCVAETDIRWSGRYDEEIDLHASVIADLIADIDMQRPLGRDGKHGSRHTATCGCDDVPQALRVRAQRFRARLRTIRRIWRTLR